MKIEREDFESNSDIEIDIDKRYKRGMKEYKNFQLQPQSQSGEIKTWKFKGVYFKKEH